ncbi:hypothetical protein BT67DRAFT_113088 [Trichocladium antarcticum]|uniref:Uncharacterized protein n=1 Tax=Trichocladium antarcticum TaxID=1450529 RepID=A0AAN6UQW0_9PEZI|nr:hypothetical protein BT67DRAFT_113088 [Trichocladium antarcticum]
MEGTWWWSGNQESTSIFSTWVRQGSAEGEKGGWLFLIRKAVSHLSSSGRHLHACSTHVRRQPPPPLSWAGTLRYKTPVPDLQVRIVPGVEAPGSGATAGNGRVQGTRVGDVHAPIIDRNPAAKPGRRWLVAPGWDGNPTQTKMTASIEEPAAAAGQTQQAEYTHGNKRKRWQPEFLNHGMRFKPPTTKFASRQCASVNPGDTRPLWPSKNRQVQSLQDRGSFKDNMVANSQTWVSL